MPTDRLERRPWELEIGWQAPRAASHHGLDGALVSQSPLPTALAPSDRLAYTLRSSIRLFLRINISLTIGETYKMVEDFSTQFSPLCP